MSFNCVLRAWVKISCSAWMNVYSHPSIFYHSTSHLIYHVFVNDIKQFMLEKRKSVNLCKLYLEIFYGTLCESTMTLFVMQIKMFSSQWYWQMINKCCCLRSSARSEEFIWTSSDFVYIFHFLGCCDGF